MRTGESACATMKRMHDKKGEKEIYRETERERRAGEREFHFVSELFLWPPKRFVNNDFDAMSMCHRVPLLVVSSTR